MIGNSPSVARCHTDSRLYILIEKRGGSHSESQRTASAVGSGRSAACHIMRSWRSGGSGSCYRRKLGFLPAPLSSSLREHARALCCLDETSVARVRPSELPQRLEGMFFRALALPARLPAAQLVQGGVGSTWLGVCFTFADCSL